MLDRDIFVHYLPWEGKKTLDKIFKTWPGSEDSLEQTLFYVQTGDGFRNKGFRCDQFSFEQFRDSEFEHLKWLSERLGGPTGSHNLGVKPEKALYSACNVPNVQSKQGIQAFNNRNRFNWLEELEESK